MRDICDDSRLENDRESHDNDRRSQHRNHSSRTWKFLYTLRRTAVCLYACVKLRAGFINVGIADDETFDEWSSSDMDFRVLKMNEIKFLHSSD